MPGEIKTPGQGSGRMPTTPAGRWALAMAGIALLSLFVFPLVTMRYRERFPIVDTWLMPALITLFVDTAALLSLFAVWRRGERSLISVLVLALTGLGALISTVAAVGGAIFGG